MEKIKRDTNTELMNKVLELVKNNGCYEKAGAIMDYFLAENYSVQELSNYEFDFVAKVNFGGSEGIYIDCYIEGQYDEKNTFDKIQRLRCGTFKTLDESLDAMKIMGELTGSLTYFAHKYINQEIDRYTPTSQKKAEKQENL